MSSGKQQEDTSAAGFRRKWVYLESNSKTPGKQGVEKLVEQVHADKKALHGLFYEVFLALTEEDAGHVPRSELVSVVNGVLRSYANIKERESVSIDLMVILQAVKPTSGMVPFFEMLDISKDLKIQYLDPFILKSSFFPDYNKAYYIDAKTNDYGLEMYSSLGECSEGYSKFIAELCGLFQGHQKVDWPDLMSRLEIIMGHFKLDTNRCFLLLVSILGLNYGPNQSTVNAFLDNCHWWTRDPNVNRSISTTIVAYLANKPVLCSGELIVIFLMTEKRWLDLGVVLSVLEPCDFEVDGDASMDELYERHKSEKKERAFRETASALALAAPLLPDDDDERTAWAATAQPATATAQRATASAQPAPASAQSSASASALVTKESTPVGAEADLQDRLSEMSKIRFISYIIKLRFHGAILYALAQYPYLAQMDDHIADLLNEYLRYLLEPLYRKVVKSEDISKDQYTDRIIDFDGLFEMSDQLMRLNGAKIARSPLLVAQLARIIDGALAGGAHAAGADKSAWLQYFKAYLFPAMNYNLSECICDELFAVFARNFPVETRYNVYGEYIAVTVKKSADLKASFEKAAKRARSFMKRLSVDNLATAQKELAQIVMAHPLAAVGAVLDQVESYESLIELVVQSAGQLPKYAWDVLTFEVVKKLCSGKTAVQEDGLNYSGWFQNLAQFVGRMADAHFRRFRLRPVLDLIVKGLRAGAHEYAGVFELIIAQMTGIRAINNLTARQAIMMNAGPSVRRMVYLVIGDKRLAHARSGATLFAELVRSGYMSELFIFVCNMSLSIADSSRAPLKILNRKCDELFSLLHTFIQGAQANIRIPDFPQAVLPVERLVKEYNVEPQWAFELWREYWSSEMRREGSAGADGSAGAEGGAPVAGSAGALRSNIPRILPQIDWNLLSPDFYCTFWQLTLYDIDYEMLSYSQEQESIELRITNNRQMLKNVDDMPTKEYKRLNSELGTLQSILSGVKADGKVHKKNYEQVLEILEKQKENWFAGERKNESRVRTLVLEQCVLPRAMHSLFDAVFVSEFIFLVQRVRSSGYNLVGLLSELFSGVSLQTVLFTNTSTETENLAMFYSEVLRRLNECRDALEAYEAVFGRGGEEEEVSDIEMDKDEGEDVSEKSMDKDDDIEMEEDDKNDKKDEEDENKSTDTDHMNDKDGRGTDKDKEDEDKSTDTDHGNSDKDGKGTDKDHMNDKDDNGTDKDHGNSDKDGDDTDKDHMNDEDDKSTDGKKRVANDNSSTSHYAAFKKQLYSWHCSLLGQLTNSMQSEEYTTRNNAVIFLKGVLASFPIVDHHTDTLYKKVSDIAATEKRQDIKLAFNALRGLIKSRKVHQLAPWEFYEVEEAEKKSLMEERKHEKEEERKKQAEALRLRRETQRKADQQRRKRDTEKIKLEAEKTRKATIKKTDGASVVPYGLVGLEVTKRAVKSTSTRSKLEKSTSMKSMEKKTVASDVAVKRAPATPGSAEANSSVGGRPAEASDAAHKAGGAAAAPVPCAPAQPATPAQPARSAHTSSRPSTGASAAASSVQSAAASSVQSATTFVTAHSRQSSTRPLPSKIPLRPGRSSGALTSGSWQQKPSSSAPHADRADRAARPLQSQRSAFKASRSNSTMQELKNRMEREKRINESLRNRDAAQKQDEVRDQRNRRDQRSQRASYGERGERSQRSQHSQRNESRTKPARNHAELPLPPPPMPPPLNALREALPRGPQVRDVRDAHSAGSSSPRYNSRQNSGQNLRQSSRQGSRHHSGRSDRKRKSDHRDDRRQKRRHR